MKFFFIFFLLCAGSFADSLDWTQKSLKIECRTSKEKKEGVFEYHNVSSKIVKFINIKASCGCVLVEKPKMISPGEKGKIRFKAPTPRAGGKYTKTIRIDTDESEEFEYALKFTIINTDEPVKRPKPLNFTGIKKGTQITPEKGQSIKTVQTLYQRPVNMTARDLIIEKLMAKQALAKKKNYTKQDECPFLPLGIVPHLYHDWNGLRIYTCCEQCLVLLKESPHHAIIKLAEKGQTPVKLENLEGKR